MLSHEEARARLESIANREWRADAETRIAKLPRKLRAIATTLVEEPEPAKDQRHYYDEVLPAGRALDSLTPKQRAEVLTAIHPRLGHVLAAWWSDAVGAPYLTDWGRRAFRLPNDPAGTVDSRAGRLWRMLRGLGPYDRDAEWVATWAKHLHFDDYGALLASAIDLGDDEGQRVFDTLISISNGDHPIGTMGRHVIVGLLRSSRDDGWDHVERLLLAAQRQEGLRQAILEAADEAHPAAFLRILDIVLGNDLLRFAASVRAAGVWLGFDPDVADIPDVQRRVSLLRDYLVEPQRATEAAADGDAWETYSALCSIAMRDVDEALRLADDVMLRESAHVRAANVRFLAATRVSTHILDAMDDPDLGVATLAGLLSGTGPDVDLFDRLEALLARLPETPRAIEHLGVELRPLRLDRHEITNLMVSQISNRRFRGLDAQPVDRLLPHISVMDPMSRWRTARLAAESGPVSPEMRRALLTMVGDRSGDVRGAAVAALRDGTIEPHEALELESLLTRKAADLRRSVIRLLANQPTADVVSSAERLWTGKAPQKDAACELLGAVDTSPADLVAVARRFAEDSPTEKQLELLAPLTGGEVVDGSDDPGLGLYDPAERAPVPSPERVDRRFGSDAALRIVSELDDLIESLRDVTFELVTWQGTQEVLLADARFLPSPFRPVESSPPGSGLILADLFGRWWADRPDDLRDACDGLDLLRALTVTLASPHHLAPYRRTDEDLAYAATMERLCGGAAGELRHAHAVDHVLSWLLFEHMEPAVIDECLDAVATALAEVTQEQLVVITDDSGKGWIDGDFRHRLHDQNPWYKIAERAFGGSGGRFTDEQAVRWYQLLRWIDQPVDEAHRHHAPATVVLRAHALGAATDHDLYDMLLFSRSSLLGAWTRRRRAREERDNPVGVALADRLRERILEIELPRGDLPTVASIQARKLGSVDGADLTVELLSRLGRSTLVRGFTRASMYSSDDDGYSRDAVFSHLLRVSYPGASDTGETLGAAASTARLSDSRLVDLAMFAPQWAATVEGALAWPGLEDAIWWYHAHTKDTQWSVDKEVRETWTALSAERTPLSGDDLLDGAVDVDWYHRAHAALGADRWEIVHKAAKLASGGSGHRRAQIFADAMRGDTDEATFLERIRSKRHQDSVRALGLVPLPTAASRRSAAALDRYRALREFERGSRKFGSQRQTSEKNAVRIGIENLARTSGFDDPQRFIWAMEAAEAGDLADGPVSVSEGDVTVTLLVDDEGAPDLAVFRGDKKLAAVPARLRKVPAIAELRQRKIDLTKQVSRVRSSLESAMVNRSTFAADDLSALARHPIVAPMLELVAFVDDDGHTIRRRGHRFEDLAGTTITTPGPLRLAHPVDLIDGGWIAWQEALFSDATRQPFKQVFRELYALTPTELAAGPGSHRWDGHQVQPRQAAALFGIRGWLADPETAEVSRVFHTHGVVARATFTDGFLTPAEVELPTISGVYFTKRSEYVAQPLDWVPPIVFSETMRDLDLVVSVAHAGGVDPEASASTVEMRATLVRETARLMRLDNVRFVESHVVIDGALGEYSLHLGSGTIHRRPGGSVCIIPVDAQRRGRVFLPFADDDPKTAEVVSKVLLLARDKEIKDPTILEQLRS